MDPNKPEDIFDAAVAISGDVERRALLDRACAGNPQMRAEVEKLLGLQGRAEKFFQKCSTKVASYVEDLLTPANNEAATSPEPPDQVIGTRLGPYKILQRIGEGGCGIVYMAEQEKPVRRKVAIKIIKLGMDTKSVIARFEAERQALALMDHPNIARVLDAGATDSGRPYFVMELVRGIRITEYCDENSLSTQARLELFIQVCEAIQHAHQKGIIHRDIKPSNILVTLLDGRPVPKVIDFGIAKAIEEKLTDKTLFTLHGMFIGTPAYMSPEQAQLSGADVDTRGDIYSLGVLLYELLTGKTPFDQHELLAGGIDEMRRTLADREPSRPSAKLNTLANTELTVTAHHRHVEPFKLRSELRGDLDWIVMKALEKDRARRYQTANGLALDVRRYLDNEPVVARPPSRIYRLHKLVRRNKAVFTIACFLALTLIASSVATTSLWLKERAARLHAKALQAEKEQADRLRESAELARKLADANAQFKDGKLEIADQILEAVATTEVPAEYAEMFRKLGDWDASNGYWTKARNRFTLLIQINQNAGVKNALDDLRYAVLLASQGELGQYECFRKSFVERYAGTTNTTTAETVIRACLLTAADDELLKQMGQFEATTTNGLVATAAEKKIGRERAAWHTYSLALLAYRQQNYEMAQRWCEQAMNFDQGTLVRDAGIRLIEAMACARLGQMDEARNFLAEGRRPVEDDAKVLTGPPLKWQGYWFDWACARILLREATEQVQSPHDESD